MKSLTIIVPILLLLSTLITAQTPTGDIGKDTTLAGQYWEEASKLKIKDTTKAILIEKALVLYQAHSLPNQTIRTQSYLAYLYGRYDNPRCLEVAEAALSLARQTYGTDSIPLVAYAYYGLQLYYITVDKSKCILFGEKAVSLFSQKKNYYYYAAYNLFNAYINTEKYKKAANLIRVYEIALNNNMTTNPKLERYKSHLAYQKMVLYFLTKNYQRSIIYGKQLLSITKINYFKTEAFQYVGQNYGELGQFKEGIKWIRKGIKQSNLDIDNDELGEDFQFIGILQFRNKDYKQAIKSFHQSIVCFNNWHSNIYDGRLRISYYYLGLCYLQLNDIEQAKTFINQQLTADTYPYLANILTAEISGKEQQYKEALNAIQHALIQLTPSFTTTTIATNPTANQSFNDVFWTGKALFIKMQLLYEQGKVDNDHELLQLSITTGELALTIFNQQRQLTKGYESSRLRYNEEINKILRVLQDSYYELYAANKEAVILNQLFQTTEKCKAMALLETLMPRDLPQPILEAETKWVNQINYFSQLIEVTTHTDSIVFYQNQLLYADKQLEHLQEEINQNYTEKDLSFEDSQFATVTSLQTHLTDNTLWLEYSINAQRNRLYIYAINATQAQVYTVPIDDRLFKNIQQLQRLLRDPFLIQKTTRERFIAVSHQLYKILIAPITTQLKEKTQLIIVPDGELFHIPFEVLLASEDKKLFHELAYLIKEYDVSYHYSATAYQELQQRPVIQNKTLFAFAPVFTDASSTGNEERFLTYFEEDVHRGVTESNFSPLPNSEREVKQIAEIVPTTITHQILLKEEATKANLYRTITQQPYQFVHIATHGLVNYNIPKLSALACYDENNQIANHSLFYANEAQMLKLQADLVVLSSCESGIGRLMQGEGLIALNRSFMYAGAKNVLFSLWKVNDKYSSELMIDFYAAYFKDTHYNKALRTAKLKMLATPTSSSPYYWAAFVLIGK